MLGRKNASRTALVLFARVLVLGVALGGCGRHAAPSRTLANGDGGSVPIGTGVSCSKDADCAPGHCVSGYCAPDCQSGADCPSGLSCNSNVCVTVCTASLSPTSASFSAAAQIGSVTVNANSECSWRASSNASWIMITAGASGSATVSYSVSANIATSSRSGTMTIAGQMFTVSQAAAAGPTVTHTLTITKIGAGSGTVTSDDGHINCGAQCSYNYPDGSMITLRQDKAAGSDFYGWQGPTLPADTQLYYSDRSALDYLIIYPLSADLTETAEFENSNLNASHCSGVFSRSLQDANRGDYFEFYPSNFGGSNDSCVYVAPDQPPGGSCSFTSSTTWTSGDWSGTFSGGLDGCSTLTIVKNGVTDVYTKPGSTPVPMAGTHLLTIVKTGAGSGTVTSDDGHINCGAQCSYSYPNGSMILLHQSKDPGSDFYGWQGATPPQDTQLYYSDRSALSDFLIYPLTTDLTETAEFENSNLNASHCSGVFSRSLQDANRGDYFEFYPSNFGGSNDSCVYVAPDQPPGGSCSFTSSTTWTSGDWSGTFSGGLDGCSTLTIVKNGVTDVYTKP